MDTRAKLLKLLEDNRETYISGAVLAKELSVSRNAVWKTVESLRLEGHCISAITNKGYRIENSGDVLSASGIMKCLKPDGVFRVEVRKSVESTNTIVRDLAAKGEPEGFVMVAEEQTAGKGRMGRDFYSPARHGVYFSLLLRPGCIAREAALITSAAAVATARAIEEVFGVSVGIKWVNDLFVGDRKVCGILTEAVFNMENGLIDSAVLGIGVNVTRPEEGFPGTLKEIAGFITDKETIVGNVRSRLIAAAISNFWVFYQSLAAREFLAEYRSRSIVLGKEIYVVSGDKRMPAYAERIDDDCGLVVRYENGDVAVLGSGEVSIRQIIAKKL